MSSSLIGLLLASVSGMPLPAQPPAGPAPDLGRVVQPPPAWVATDGGSHWLTYGSYCWADGRHGLCADTMGPFGMDLTPIAVRRGEPLEFHFAFTPSYVRVTRYPGRKQARLSPGTRVRSWTVKGRPRYLTLFVRARRGGDVSYYMRLKVGPASG